MLRVDQSQLRPQQMFANFGALRAESAKVTLVPGTTAAHTALDLTATCINSVLKSFLSKLNMA